MIAITLHCTVVNIYVFMAMVLYDALYDVVFVTRKENVYNLVMEKAKKKLVCISKIRPFVITLKATTIYTNRSTESVVYACPIYCNVTSTR